MAGIVALVGLFFLIKKLPEIKDDGEGEQKSFSIRVFRHRHVTWAVIAQFFYVGAQVCIGSFFIRYSRFVAEIPEKQAAFWWGFLAMVGFMVGRFAGTFLMKYIKPSTLLAVYSLISIGLLIISLIASGNVAVYSLIAVPFFMSIMFPTIFALGIKGLNDDETKIASSFLIMSLVGGAILPLFMGIISDRTSSIQIAYIVPLLCFLVVFYFGWQGYKYKDVVSLR